ncbi:chromate transporter [Halobacillus karajensis]|uniref:Chromate transport protein n=1 Tax=Halobacillus karajensis TaxID=195088 RepID=A0A024P8X1_9BACI|nr:chromate efflux transporter [Halobacillus karajensis]CDQ20163.1 Chromate transport protein [Halobacillus karajensis]CDQ25176.1 Chromate transport protein [Halobacillus karajensis]CDQ28463.1 Chromate transport protein [Halobacillus karajensis]SEI01439.1 chromate transporter [Halobacillus karajensis]
MSQKQEKNKIQTLLEILVTSTKLGLTSFGGPVAHLGYFKDEYIDRRKWLNDKTYADLIALCQFLPGPASSQVGISIGILRGGILGGVTSFLGFTVPSVIVLVIFALLYQHFTLDDVGFIHSLKVVAAAVVLHALIGLGKKLTPDKSRMAIALAAALIMLLYPSAWIQIMIILAAGLVGLSLFKNKAASNIESFPVNISKKTGVLSLTVLGSSLIVLPLINNAVNHSLINIFDTFFRVGSLVFGGGHVVLPMIERELVPQGLLSPDEFLAGYGMAQAVPGPLFTFSSYLGTMMEGITGAVVATIAIFLPSFLLIIGALPFLSELRKRASFQGILMGVNASVVGILLAAFYDPVIKSSIFDGTDFALGVILFALLNIWKVPAWLIVIIGVIGGYILNGLGF